MITHRRMLSTSIAMALAASTSLVAQVTTGTLAGRVTQRDGKPVQGARVILESPALFQPKTLTTDARGEYRALLLPVGNYTLKLSAPDLLGKTATDIRVGIGSNQTLDFVLQPVDKVASATVEVVSSTGLQESVSADKVSVNFSAEQLLQLPTSRSFTGAMTLAPGITGSDAAAMIRGSQAGQIVFRIDGLDVRDNSNTGAGNQVKGAAGSLYEPLPDSIEDIQVVLSALNARNGRAQGGQVNIATRSGSNTFEGTVRAYMTRNSWRANNPGAGSDATNHGAAAEDFSRYTDVTASGPILKDRLWFYVGARIQPGRSSVSALGVDGIALDGSGRHVKDIVKAPLTTWGTWANVDNVLFDGPADKTYTVSNVFKNLGDLYTASTKFNKYEGKLTGMVNDNNTLTFAYMTQKSTVGGSATEGLDTWITADRSLIGDAIDEIKGYTLNWNSILSDNWTLEARYSKVTHDAGAYSGGPGALPVLGYWSTRQRGQAPNDPAVLRFNQITGGNWTTPGWLGLNNSTVLGPFNGGHTAAGPAPRTDQNHSFSVNVKTFLQAMGQHEVDLGFEIFKTVNGLGRGVYGNGKANFATWVANPNGDILVPVYYTVNDAPIVAPNLLNDGTLYHWGRSPVPGFETFYTKGTQADNKANAFWLNDIWTLNAYVTILGGLRHNTMAMYATDGREIMKSSVTEPRFQVKWNPDGAGKEVLSFSFARFASILSDGFTTGVRGQEYEQLAILSWAGLHDAQGNLVQPAINNLGGGTDNGMYGVRWVTTKDLANPKNWGKASFWRDSAQSYDTSGLKVPYTDELQLGYQRNYEGGRFSLNLVQRTYRNNLVQWARDYSPTGGTDTRFLALVKNPGNPAEAKWSQRQYWLSTDKDDTYRGVEVSWMQQLTERASFGGCYTWSQVTGMDPLDYHNYRSLRESQLNATQQAAALADGYVSRDQVLRLFTTYVKPVGRGNVSASLLASYITSPVGNDLYGYTNYQVNPYASTINGYGFMDGGNSARSIYGSTRINTAYRTYAMGRGELKTGLDTYAFDLRLQGQVPIGVGKVMLTGYVQINNVFNHIRNTAFLDASNTFGEQQAVQGRVLLNPRSWGALNDASAFTGARNVGEFSIGLKF